MGERIVNLTWQWYRLADIPATLLIDILKLRQDVFIIEQRCLYHDIDGLDRLAHHLTGCDESGTIMAYCRAFAPGDCHHEPVLGRIVTAPTVRRRGLGRSLLDEAHRYCRKNFGTPVVRLDAQHYLTGYYCSFGYEIVGEPRDVDGIAHVEMLKTT